MSKLIPALDNVGKADLVLQGGGVKGIGLVGAVSKLRETAYPHIQRVAGTSAGAIVASLIAAGMNDVALEVAMRELDYAQFEQTSLIARTGALGKGFELVRRGGIYQTGYLHNWVADQLASCGVHTWSDLHYADSDLPAAHQYRLVVIVSDLSRGRMLRLPWDYRLLCDLDPDTQPVADAVTASASIPFFFQAQHLTCGPAQGNRTLVLTDGGSLSNYPIDLFDRDDPKASRWPTLGIRLAARQVMADEWRPITRPIVMLRRLFATMSDAHDRVYTDDPAVAARSVFVDTTGISATDFSLSDAQRDQLFAAGQSAATRFLDGWSWEQWQQTYRPVIT